MTISLLTVPRLYLIPGEGFVQHTFFGLQDEGNSISDPDDNHRPNTFHFGQRPNDKRPSDLHRPIGGGGLDRPHGNRPSPSFEIERPHSDGNDSPILIFTDDHKPLTRPTRIPNPPDDDDFHSIFSDRPHATFPPFPEDDRRPIFQERPDRPSFPSEKPSIVFKPDHDDQRPDFIFEEDLVFKPPKRPLKPGRPHKPFRPGPVRHDPPPTRHPLLEDFPHERGNYAVTVVTGR